MLSPLFLLIALWIKVESWFSPDCAGPVFFTETRISRGHPFSMYKFKTVRQSILRNLILEKPKLGISRYTSRGTNLSLGALTPSGRVLTRIYFDELPQLFNILNGDMSMVGPRPHTPKHYSEDLAEGLLSAKHLRTGLFGLVQASKGDLKLRTSFAQIFDPDVKRENVMHSIDALYLQRCRTLSSLKLLAFDLWIIWHSLVIVFRAKGL